VSEWDADKVRVQVARDLREIVRLWRMLPEEAEAQAAGHDPGELDALNLAGPAANLEAWENRFETAERLGRDTTYASDQVAERHVLLVLGDWEERVRHEREQPTDLRTTVPRAADYLGKSIDWIVVHFDGAPEMAAEIRVTASMLENVLRDGVRHDASAAACFKDIGGPEEVSVCGGRLVRRLMDPKDCRHVKRAIEMSKGIADPVTVLRQTLMAFPEDEMEHRSCDQGGRDDVYRCQNCGGFYTEAEYWLAVREHYERQAG